MLELLVTIIIVLVVAGFAIWLLSFLTIDATLARLIRGLVIFFAVLFVIYTLWNGRAVFHIG